MEEEKKKEEASRQTLVPPNNPPSLQGIPLPADARAGTCQPPPPPPLRARLRTTGGVKMGESS